MAARDAFENFIGTLAPETKDKLREYLREQRTEMFAARSEDERTRITDEFVKEVHDRLKKAKPAA